MIDSVIVGMHSCSTMAKSSQVAIRLEPAALALIDDLVDALTRQSALPDVRPTRSAVIRAALDRGLEQMRREVLTVGRKQKRK